jgi:RNA polymerase sigma-19 factor, ECF subfamily
MPLAMVIALPMFIINSSYYCAEDCDIAALTRMPLPEKTPISENDLLLEVSAGSEQAFSQLFYSYHQRLASYIYQLTGSRHMAEEVVQDVFLKIWNTRESLGSVKNFNTWLFVISKNHALNALRKTTQLRLQQLEWSSIQPSETELTDSFDNERYRAAIEAIEQLPAQQQKVFILHRVKKLKYQDIANELHVSRETVKSYLKLANSSVTRFIRKRSSTFLLCFILLRLFSI